MADAPLNRVRQRWGSDAPAALGWMQTASPIVAETLAGCGYDALVVDLQHGLIDHRDAPALFAAIELRGIEPFVRVRANDAGEIGWLLDAGARGIIAPLIDTESDARALAQAIHYPPRGRRSYGPRRPLLRHGTGYRQHASETIVTLAMVETAGALRDLDDILSVDGLDGVFIGPADLALALGEAPEGPPTAPVDEVIEVIRRRASAAGRRAGIFGGTVASALGYLEAGFDLVSLPSDLAMLAVAGRAAVAALAERSC